MAPKKKPDTEILLGKRPSIWFTEGALAQALDQLESVDPDHQMTKEQAEEFIGDYVLGEAIERRDEVAEFILAAEALAQMKLQMASVYIDDSKRITAGVDRMRESVRDVMKRMGATKLAGHAHILKLKDSPGSVKVLDEDQIPEEFRPVKDDIDLQRIAQLTETVERQAREIYSLQGVEGEDADKAIDSDDNVIHARECLRLARLERVSISKKLIQAAWKENGGDTVGRTDPETGEIIETPLIPGVEKEVTTKLEIE